MQHFDGDWVVLRIHAEVDDTHAAGTEFVQQPIAAEFLYCHSTQVSGGGGVSHESHVLTGCRAVETAAEDSAVAHRRPAETVECFVRTAC
nr:hypothetical protein GCM10023233_03790 [Brevibacterium otitidis]